jgi:fluoroquinolone transport system permease protein
MRVQSRNGLYLVTGLVIAGWVAVRLRLPAEILADGWLLPPFLVGNVILSTFYFVGGLVLLEKGEATLTAQVVTPLRPAEYLAARVATLTLLTLIENIALAILVFGPGIALLPLAVGVVLAAIIFTLAGFAAVARYDSINAYLMPSVLYTSALSVPMVAYLLGIDGWPLYLHPLAGPFVFLEAAVGSIPAPEMGVAIVSTAAWVTILAAVARRAFDRLTLGDGRTV